MIKVYVDPSSGAGVPAPCGEHARHEPSGTTYIKVDVGDTDWLPAVDVYAGGEGGGPHSSSHEDGGSDELDVTGLTGLLSTAQTPAGHAHAQSDVTGLVTALAGKEATGVAASLVAAHEAASDPHTAYQKEAEKGVANGYAGLDATGLVPLAQLPPLGGGSGNALETTVDFGSGDDLATTTVTGQAWVTSSSKIVAQVFGSTADHDAEDALIEQLKVTVTNRVAGVGFDVIAHAPEGTHGQYLVHCVGV